MDFPPPEKDKFLLNLKSPEEMIRNLKEKLQKFLEKTIKKG